jgi:hypothetical protein
MRPLLSDGQIFGQITQSRPQKMSIVEKIGDCKFTKIWQKLGENRTKNVFLQLLTGETTTLFVFSMIFKKEKE